MSKNYHTKKVMNELNVFRKKISARQDISDEIQTSIYLIRCELQTPVGKFIYCKEKNERQFWLNIMDNKNVDYKSYGKIDYRKEHSIR